MPTTRIAAARNVWTPIATSADGPVVVTADQQFFWAVGSSVPASAIAGFRRSAWEEANVTVPAGETLRVRNVTAAMNVYKFSSPPAVMPSGDAHFIPLQTFLVGS